MRRRWLLTAAVMLGLCVAAPSGAAAQAPGGFTRVPAIVAEGMAQQCIVPQLVLNMPLGSARTLLSALGCRVRVAYQASSSHRGRVVAVRGGLRSWPYQHVVTVIVSAGD